MQTASTSSFRDPSGILVNFNGKLYRKIHLSYKEHYDHFKKNLYARLLAEKLIIPHKEVFVPELNSRDVYKIIVPEKIDFISYPFEWCFSQLKDAALTTLNIQKIALENGMQLKDSSAYNIQFYKGSPLLIDTLSFEKYEEGKGWTGYRQFCEHFLAPLALMTYRDTRLNLLLRSYLDGVPLDLADKLLPHLRLRPALLTHLTFHSMYQNRFKEINHRKVRIRMTRRGLEGLIGSLQTAVSKLKLKKEKTIWGDYYDKTNYSQSSFSAKEKIIKDLTKYISPSTIWDIASNSGVFSRIAGDNKIPVIAMDNDHAAIEKLYNDCKQKSEVNIVPVIMDITNPSPACGLSGEERSSLIQRGPSDLVLALSIVHHLAITNNIPFARMAYFFSRICKNHLIVEFIPRTDSNTQRLLASKTIDHHDYTKEGFEKGFSQFFKTIKVEPIPGSLRTIYLMKKK